jgi:enoyl-CoA hydratase/carnithine racemase
VDWYRTAVSTSLVEGITVVDLGDGENRLTPEVVAEFHSALDTLEDGTGPRALVTMASGKIWSNGLDIEHLTANPSEFFPYLADVQVLLARVIELGCPTVAAVTGHAFGAGAMLSLCHDVSVMRDDRGYWCLPEVDLDMDLTAGEHAVVAAKLSPATLNLALTTGHRFSAAAAIAAGIVQEVQPPEMVVDRAMEIAMGRSPKAAGSLTSLKRGMYGHVAAVLRKDAAEGLSLGPAS